MDTPLVVAFSDTPALRETLCVLLEQDCRLRFLGADALASAELSSAGLAVVAMQQRYDLVRDLRRHWPGLPVVAVELPDVAGTTSPAAAVASSDPKLCSVPLEPHAIRTSVLQRLAPQPDAALARTVKLVTEALHKDLTYCFAALRTFSALHATSAGPDTYALLGAVMREQSAVLDEAIDLLERFRGRPRTAPPSADFCTALSRELERSDPTSAGRGVLCQCVVQTPCWQVGPTGLAPVVATFLRAHARRRSDSPVLSVCVTNRGLIVRYAQRRTVTTPPSSSWPLLLASLALQPWLWSVSAAANGQDEAVSVCPVSSED